MRLESSIHCGDVVSCRRTEQAVYIATRHGAGTRYPHHAHMSPHLAIVLDGAYFERIGDECFLRLPGDEVYYPEYMEHEDRFGRIPASCLNVETFDGSRPETGVPRAPVSPSVETAKRLAEDGGLRSVSEVARVAGYHPVYLSRAFRKAFGGPVGALMRVARVRRAAELVFRSDLTLGAIAVDAGYCDQSHLTNELRNLTGFTPGELRRLADS